MKISFDISEDELQIFMAEANEQLQMLDEGIVRLEQESNNEELLQAIFRAAHTLKGSAGAIGHKRMAALTHAMETALDGIRKGTLDISSDFVDTCLEALDALRLLLTEVVKGEVSQAETEVLVDRLYDFVGRTMAPRPTAPAATPPASAPPAATAVSAPPARPAAPTPPAPVTPLPPDQPAAKPPVKTTKPPVKTASQKHRTSEKPGRGRPAAKAARQKKGPAAKAAKAARRQRPAPPTEEIAAPPAAETPPAAAGPRPASLTIIADISSTSIASAARAFQLMLALQGVGEVRHMDPSQEQIETALPVHQLIAEVATSKSAADILKALSWISEVDRLQIDGQEFILNIPEPPPEPPPAEAALKNIDPAAIEKLGEYLIKCGLITREQLQAALQTQAGSPLPPDLLGQTLVKMGILSQDDLDHAIADQIQQLRAVASAAQTESPDRLRTLVTDKTVRTSVERLDTLMNLVGELITDRNRMFQIRTDFEARYRNDPGVDNLVETAIHISRITDQLQEEVMRIRMQPIANVFNKFPRLVRDLARKAGKLVDLEIHGEDTELDRSVIEEISDPLLHLLRNAVDHGIEMPETRRGLGKSERGAIVLTAQHEESRIIITVRDDGQGIDADEVKAAALRKGLLSEAEATSLTEEEAIQLIFRSGLSTAKIVTDISGRGVGMDIVRTNIERLNGTISVETWLGHGTRIQVALPLTLAIIPALLVLLNETTYAIPLASVMEAHLISAADIHMVNKKPMIKLRGHVVPLVRLREALGFRPAPGPAAARGEYMVTIRWGKMEMGVVVDKLVGEQELVIKSLGALVGETQGTSGAAILGDGRVALIVDVSGLFKLAGA